MKKRAIVPGAAILSALALFSCGKPAQNNAGEIQPVNVRVETVRPQRFTDVIEIAGTVRAYEEAQISPEEGGVVKEWKVRKGQQVKKGDLIVVLKDDVIRAGFDAADAQYKMAELNLEKQRKVYDEQGISELQLKNLEYGRDAAKANADLMKARWAHTQIASPIDGTLDNTVPKEGEMAPPGMPLARVVNMSMVKIATEIPESYAATVSVGTPAVVTFDALPGDTLKGRVSFVGSSVSEANRTLAAEIVEPNPFRNLKADMIAKVKLIRVTKTDAFLVSENIVQLVDRDRSIVYVESGGRARERRLRLGARQGNLLEVLEGLRSGDRIITEGFQKLVDGTPVTIVQVPESPR